MKRLPSFFRLIILTFSLLLTQKGYSYSQCESCLRDSSNLNLLSSYDGSFQRNICDVCIAYSPECFVCKLPALKNSRLHDDKRLFCNRDFHAAIFSYDEMDRLTHQTTLDLNRAFYRFNMQFGATNVSVSLVSSATLYDLLKLRFNPQQAGIVGLTLTKCFDPSGKEVKFDERHKEPAGTELRYEHEIFVANGFPEQKIKAILAHELAHVWIHENLPYERANAIDSDTVEGFCELVAYQLMESDNAVHVKTGIRKNLYTVGQQNILIEVESGYGFNRILQWLYKGTNRRLQNADLVRQVSNAPLPTRQSSAPATPAVTQPVTAATNTTAATTATVAAVPAAQPQAPQPPARPSTVVLKGVFLGKNKSALVNDLTIGEGEEHQLKMAEGLLGIKCIEIRPTSVILAVNGETKEYFVGRPAVPVKTSGD